MRLLSTKTLEVTPISEDEIPPYAILSHTWDKDEVTLQDMQGSGASWSSTGSRDSHLNAKQGFQKVSEAAKLAASEGHGWIWIDTCCIDKTSSAELSEAINSMYKWYQNSDICYVYLADAITKIEGLPGPNNDIMSMISNSRWITRGWTLQELIAPRTVSFYSNEWSFVGSRNDEHIMGPLAEATGIDVGVLSGDIVTHEVTVANRMRWASKRETRRQEDMAYCLMGLFGVNMPLLYGEGGVRAFIRLQTEILQATDDQTIFAWPTPLGHKEPTGLLAESPAYFRDAPRMYPISGWHQSDSSIPWSMTNRGLLVQLYLRPSRFDTSAKEDPADQYLAILDCSAEVGGRGGNSQEWWVYENSPAITLRRLWGDQYARLHDEPGLEYVDMRDGRGGGSKTIFVKQDQSLSMPSFMVPEILLRGTGYFVLSQVYPRDPWDSKSGIFKAGLSRERCIQGLFRFSYPPSGGASDGIFDVAVTLQATSLGRFEPFGILRPPEGRTLRQAYDSINKVWVSTPASGKSKIAVQYQDNMVCFLRLRAAHRYGGTSYVLDLAPRAELSAFFGHFPAELEDKSLDRRAEDTYFGSSRVLSTANGRVSAEDRLRSLLRPICVSETSQPCRLLPLGTRIRVRSRNELYLPRRSTLRVSGTFESTLLTNDETAVIAAGCDRPLDHCCSFVRHEIHCDRPQGVDLCCASFLNQPTIEEGDIIAATHPETLFEQRKPFQFWLSHDRLVHFAALVGDTEMVSALIRHWDASESFPGVHMASVLHNALEFRECLSRWGRKNEIPLNSIQKLSVPLGGVQGTQDTALHYMSTYSTKAEFEIMTNSLLQAAEGLQQWEFRDNKPLCEYLFGLQNSNGETVLHRAAATSNLEVVSYICEHAPDVARRLDSMNRSTLFHAACGGDERVVSVIAATLESLTWAPGVDYPDDNGLTPLHVACREGYLSCVETLLELGASPLCATQSAGLTPIHYASLFGHSECLTAVGDRLTLAGHYTILPHEENKGMIHPMHLAAANGWLECVKVLVRQGSTFNTLASVMCVMRESPSHSMNHESVNHTGSSNIMGETEVLVQRIPRSTAQGVAARRGWDEVVEYLRSITTTELLEETLSEMVYSNGGQANNVSTGLAAPGRP